MRQRREKTRIVDVMKRIRESNKAVITGIEEKDITHWVTIYVMGKAYRVPAGLTLMQALEFAGYRYIRGAGCRAGFCGACATVYRMKGEYKLRTAMACQTRVEDGMYLVQIPFTPAEKPCYNLNDEKAEAGVFLKYFPEIVRCVSCNTCTKACPQDLEVMDCIQAALRGDFKLIAEESFDCIQCGLCAIRCPAEIVHYHVTQLARRLYGRYLTPPDPNLRKRIEELNRGKYEKAFNELLQFSKEKLMEEYQKREIILD